MAYNETPTDWTAMLKNREARIRFVKTKDKPEDDLTAAMDEVFNEDSTRLIEETGKRLIKHFAIAMVITVGAIKVIDTLGDIAVKKTKSADQK
jgi:hypothetical protein